MSQEPEVVAYLFDYEDHRKDETVVPTSKRLTRYDPRTSERWSHVEITEIHELVRLEQGVQQSE